ncbi:MAG: UvrB/UvrC motif-containing protein [Patescibacteria group bacterium]
MGKAKNLKSRINSYKNLAQLSSRIKQLVQSARKLKYQVLANELIALLTEAELIRTYQPRYNILFKDDKSPLYIHISKDKFAQVKQVRKQDMIHHHLQGTLLGPFASAFRVKEVLKLARKIFPWCDRPNQAGPNQAGPNRALSHPNQLLPSGRACFYYHLDQCPGACLGLVSAARYHRHIQQLTLFLRGQSHLVQKELKLEMQNLSQTKQYEQAGKIRDQLKAIEAVTSQPISLKPDLSTPGLTRSWPQDTSTYLKRLIAQYAGLPDAFRLQRIEGYDVSNTSGQLAVVSMVVFENGQKNGVEYRLFNIKTLHTPNDYQMMKEALARRANHPEWCLPDLIVIDGGRGQLRAALTAWPHPTPIVSLAKDPDRIMIPVLDKNRQPITYHELKLPRSHPALQLVQAVRDEAHRFSKQHYIQRRAKKMLYY